MKKGTLLFLSFSILTVPVLADKIDVGSRALLRGNRTGIEFVATSQADKCIGKAKKRISDPNLTVNGFITLKEGASVDELKSMEGVKVVKQRDDLLMVEVASDALDQVEKSSAVRRFKVERKLKPNMDIAREVTHVNEIHSGQNLPASYTGKGVVAGIVDGGFDPNHVNFKNEDGTSRITHFTYYRPTQSGSFVEEKYGAEYIPNIDTEDDTNFHGTHTMGIMAGSYKGKVISAVKKNGFTGENVEIENPYYGVATGAEIAASAGALSDYYIALGIESILDYAYQKNMPSVINLSLGSNVGPHDGTSTICKYIDAVSDQDRVVFCISAGNEGDMPIALHKKFAGTDNSLKSFLFPGVVIPNFPNLRYGQTYFYSDSKEQFTVQAIIVNTKRNAVAFRMPLEASSEAVMKYWVSSDDYKDADTDIVSPNLAKYFTGYIGLGAELDEESGRYYAVLDCMAWDNSSTNPNGQYILGFEITGADGQRVDVFCDGEFNNFSSYNLEGYSDGMTDGTISDVACGHNAIIVGSYNTRDDWASLDNGVYGYKNNFPSGEMSPFTSWGTLVDGRKLPTVCAPGATVISSSNEYYLKKYEATDADIQAKLTGDGRNYSWHQCVGTSMATPVVTGSIALWMEANPNLTYKDVQNIIAKTSVKDDVVAASVNPVQWGAGKFNAYEGLKEVLRSSSVNGSDVSVNKPVITPLGKNLYSVFSNEKERNEIRIYDISGRLVDSRIFESDETNIDFNQFTPGVYLLKVNESVSVKIMVK